MGKEGEQQPKSVKRSKFLDGVERVGNKLPDPVILFIWLVVLVAVISWIGSICGWSAISPANGKLVTVFNLLSPAGFQYMISNCYQNMSTFAPLAIALPLFIAVGIADKSGFLDSLFIRMGMKVSGTMLTAIVIFLGISSNFMSDIGFVILPPLAAMLFLAVGRNPIVGMCCAYAATGCGLAANLLIGISDARISATSQAAAAILDPNAVVLPTCNWYFIAVACIVLTVVNTFVTEKVLEPRMGKWDPSLSDSDIKAVDLSSYQTTPEQKKGMRAGGISILIMLAVLIIGVIPPYGFLCDANGVNVFNNQKMQLGSIVTAMVLLIGIPGIVYGKVAGTISDGKALGSAMAKGIRDVAPFIVLCFFAGQFTGWFTTSNLGSILAVNGAAAIRDSGLSGLPLMLILVVVCALINLFVPSANAKYSLLAPILVPMFMMLGYSPALTQMVYRMGDSVTNAITPVMAYFAMLLGLVKTYDKRAGMGTLMSLLMPYTLSYLLTWVVLFSVWFLAGWPLGPGGQLYL